MLDQLRALFDQLLFIGGWALLIIIIGLVLHTDAAVIGLISLLPLTVRGLLTLVVQQRASQFTVANQVGSGATADNVMTSVVETPVNAEDLAQMSNTLQEITIQQRGELSEQSQISKQIVRLADDLNKSSSNARRESVKWSAANSQMRATLNTGRESLTAVLLSLTETRANSEQNIVALTEVARYVRRVGQLIASVNEIATQSNFLALNTAIEAARAETPIANTAAGLAPTMMAGGASFATVADEMRLLADQSRAAVGQLRAALIETQGALTRAAAVSEAAVAPLEQSNTAAQQLENVFSKLSEALDRSVSAAQQIAATTDQQAASLETMAQTAETVEPLVERMRSEWQVIDSVSRNLTKLAEAF